jgi:teichuronic acid biosynthesis glycosyltransferase TuaC
MIRVLVFSTLYPNAIQPRHGIFVETRLRQLLKTQQIEARVLAPIPWFPFTHPRFGRYAEYAKAPRREQRHDVQIEHPRYGVIPKWGMTWTPTLLFRAAARAIRRMQRKGYDFDVIDAHYFYPDGVAAIKLGELFNKPVFITARGTDINVIPNYPGPRRMIIEAANKATANITVSESLKQVMVGQLGIAPEKVMVFRNGVDLELFRPVEREMARERLGMKRKTILSVGNLVELKGHDLVIRALLQLPDVDLMIIGEGELRASLVNLVHQLGLEQRVQLVGNVAQERLREYYGAADALVLASSREGWPNVLLECMACGTPVVATRVGGTPEIIQAPEAGVLIDARNPEAIAQGLTALWQRQLDPEATRQYARKYSWDETSAGLLRLFARVAAPADLINEGVVRAPISYNRPVR